MKELSLMITVTLLTFSLSLNAQTYSDLITDKEVHSFVVKNKELFGGKRLDNKIVSWNYCELCLDKDQCWKDDLIQKDSDTLITNAILEELKIQFDGLKESSIDSFMDLKDKSDKKKCYRVSIPIFSADGNLAIIKISNWCGDECGSGGIMIFKRVGVNNWKKVDMRNTWIS